MAITLVPEPTTGAPLTATDYSYQNGLIAANEVPDLSFLTDWELVAAAPLIKKGVYIYHAGNTYIVDTADEAISGTPAAGYNYIELTLSGSTITAAWVTSTTGYTFNPAYGGIYNGTGKQLLPDICYLDGTDYIRGRSFGMGFSTIYLANGNLFFSGALDTNGGGITTTGGDVNTGGGDVNTNTGGLILNGGTIDSVLSGDFLIDGSATESSWSISTAPTVIPKGVYIVSSNSSLRAEAYFSGAWRVIADDYIPALISDGTNVWLRSTSGTITVYYRKL